MTSTPFVYLTSTDYARTHPDPAVALAEALDENTEAPIKAQMLTGLAARPDLKATHLRAIVKNIGYQQYTLTTTLLNNPAVQRATKVHASIRDNIHPDAIPTLLNRLDNPAAYLPQMLRIADRHSMFPDLPQRILDAFTPEQIRAALDPMIEGYLTALADGTARSDDPLPGLSFLASDQVDRLVLAVSNYLTALDPTDPLGLDSGAYEPALSRLLARPTLTLPQADALMDGLITLARIEETRFQKWCDETAADTSGYGYGYRIARLLNQTTLPEPVMVRALLCPPVRDALIADKNIRVGITGDVVIEAVRQGAPVSLLERYYVHDLPADVLALCVDRLTIDPTLGSEESRETLAALAYAAIHAIGTPAWEALYALWAQVVPDTSERCTQNQFAHLIKQRAMNWADESTSPVMQEFAAWASTSTDPLLRRHAVIHAYTQAQLVAAAADPDWEVRYEALAHPEVTEHVLNLLADDPSVQVRLGIANHTLSTAATLTHLHADPNAQVRLAVAKHPNLGAESLGHMSEDPDEFVRYVINERFIDSISSPPR